MHNNEVLNYSSLEEKSKSIQDMFNTIAGRYDRLNKILSFRKDSSWRKLAIKEANIQDGDNILDLACGTGEMIIEICKQLKNVNITGGDFSISMLNLARQKIPESKLTAADAQNLPFKSESFNKITMAFGFRNVADKQKALKELFRVLKNNGKVVILEFTEPNNKPISFIYHLYTEKILPFIGGVLSGNKNAYRYLPESVQKFPQDNVFKEMILEAGFSKIKFKKRTFGAVSIVSFEKN